MDRLENIKRRWKPSPTTKASQSYEQATSDINWLVAEIDRLRKIEDACRTSTRCLSYGAKKPNLTDVLRANPRPKESINA